MTKTQAQIEDDACRLYNLKQVIQRDFAGDHASFFTRLASGVERTAPDFFESTMKMVRKVLRGDSGLTDLMAGRVEAALELQHGSLVIKREKKSPAYVLLRCTGPAAYSLLEQLKGHHLVDEVAVVVGNADLFIRVYGTQRQVQIFLTKTLHEMSGGIHESTTYFSFDECAWQKFLPSENRHFGAIRQEDLQHEANFDSLEERVGK